jgi:hypothetical protein
MAEVYLGQWLPNVVRKSRMCMRLWRGFPKKCVISFYSSIILSEIYKRKNGSASVLGLFFFFCIFLLHNLCVFCKEETFSF